MSSVSRSIFIGLTTLVIFALALSFDRPETLPASPSAGLEPAPPPAVASPYWKGNLHTHSLWSDGDDFPEMIVDWYKRHGYHFLALTEHNLIAEAERWVDAEANATRKAAVEKYIQRLETAGPNFAPAARKKKFA